MFVGVSCSLMATRPVQEMSLTSAALKAAHEVHADTLSPDYFSQARDWFEQAKTEYRFKNFYLAKQYADKSRVLAEKAELNSLLKGGARTEEAIPDPLDSGFPRDPHPPISQSSSSREPYVYPSPTGTPAEDLEQRRAQDLNSANKPKSP